MLAVFTGYLPVVGARAEEKQSLYVSSSAISVTRKLTQDSFDIAGSYKPGT